MTRRAATECRPPRTGRRVAVVGATGAVGRELCTLLRERRFPLESLRLLASQRSAGKPFPSPSITGLVELATPDSFAGIDLAFFCAGAAASRQLVPHALRAGATVIDNSSAFRLETHVPLVVPEINPQVLSGHQRLIANPNCSTIIMALVLWPLHQQNPIRRVVVATYQAASGAGARGLLELEAQTKAVLAGCPAQPAVFPVPCAFNVFSHDSPVGADGYNAEETKMILETRKIFGDQDIGVSPTCMRVPVMRAHTEALSVELTRPMSVPEARRILAAAPGLKLVDDPASGRFPTPLEATGRDEVLVGRIRQDPAVPDRRGLQLICSGDQLRKGAALNAVQIAELLYQRVGALAGGA